MAFFRWATPRASHAELGREPPQRLPVPPARTSRIVLSCGVEQASGACGVSIEPLWSRIVSEIDMSDTASAALFGLSAGAALVAAVVLSQQWARAFAFRVGVVLFGLLALVAIANVLDASMVRVPAWAIQTSGALTAALFPAAWLYVRDLTSDQPRPWGRGDAWHFAVPALFAPHVAWAAFLSAAAEDSLWGIGEPPPEALWFAGVGQALTLAWTLQVTFYTARIALVLWRLPARLRQAFADVRGRDLTWLRVILFLFVAHLPFAVASNLGLAEVPDLVFAAFASALTCAFAGWATQQAPVFQLTTSAPERVSVGEVEPKPNQKYARALLDDEKMERIALKIGAVFDKADLHLDANLSLAKLSERLGVTENHLSQTFSRHIGASFFDYVNARRVAHAKRLLETTTDSVADIAVASGFNARSAFYNAFRLVTGSTPAAYRQEMQRTQSGSSPLPHGLGEGRRPGAIP